MIVTRAVQLQPKQKRGMLMKTRRTVANTIAVLTFSTMLMAAQMQMPTSTPGTSKPAEASSASKNANRDSQRLHVWRSPHGKGKERG